MHEKHLELLKNIKSSILSFIITTLLFLVAIYLTADVPSDDFTGMPNTFILFGITFFTLFKYLKIKENLTELSKTIIGIIYAYSYSLFWTILIVNDGKVKFSLNITYFIIGIVVPYIVFELYKDKIVVYKEHFLKSKIKKESEVENNKANETKIPNKNKIFVSKEKADEDKFSLKELKIIYDKMGRNEIKNRLNKILLILEEILKKQTKLNFDQSYEIDRIINKDLYNLLELYNGLSREERKKNEKRILQKLYVITRHLEKIKKGVGNTDLMEFEKQMELIDERYDKKK